MGGDKRGEIYTVKGDIQREPCSSSVTLHQQHPCWPCLELKGCMHLKWENGENGVRRSGEWNLA